MLFRQLFHPQASTYAYLLAADYGSEALIIDPVLEQFELYQQLILEFGLQLKYVLETHMHADHITASAKLRQCFNCQIVMGEQTVAQRVDRRIVDNEWITIDGLSLRAIYTPGHTDDCYCYGQADRVFTGDTLLIRGTGRTDFQSGNARQQYHSIFDKLLSLPTTTLVYPAHDYRGMTVSTIGEERQHNPRLQVTSAEEYAQIMDNLKLAPPKMIEQAVPANLRCGDV